MNYIQLQHIHPQYDNKEACPEWLRSIKSRTDGFYQVIVRTTAAAGKKWWLDVTLESFLESQEKR